MGDKGKTIIKLGIGLSIVSIILYIAQDRQWYLGNWGLIGDELIALFGWLFAFGIAIIYFIQPLDMLRCLIYSASIGISISVIVGYMYNNNILFDSIITGVNTLWEIQFIIIVLWIFVGIIKGAADNE